MKQFLYFVTFTVSAGTIGLVATQPQFFQQDGPLFGLRAEGSQPASVATPTGNGEQLAKFMSDYPYANHVPVPADETPAGFASTRRPSSAPMTGPDVGYASTSGKIPANDSSATFGLFDQWSEPPAPIQEPEAVLPGSRPPISAPQQSPAVFTPIPVTVSPQQAIPQQPVAQQPAPVEAWMSPPKTPPITRQPVPAQVVQAPSIPPQPVREPEAVLSPYFGNTTGPQIPVLTPPPAPVQPTVDPFLAALGSPIPPATPAPPPPITPSPSQEGPQNPVSLTMTASVPPPIAPSPEPTLSKPPTAPQVPMPTQYPVARQPAPAPVQQPAPQSVASVNPSSQFQINPSVIAEEVPCHGTEMVARVGTEVILMCDILPQMRRMANQIFRENLKQVPEDKRQQVIDEEKEGFLNAWIEMNYPAFLRKQIEDALVYNDFKMSKGREERGMIEKKMNEDFDLQDVSGMMKEFGVSDIVELKTYLENELGSSLERERLLTVRSRVAQQWAMLSIQHAEGECGQEEMMEYYTKNRQEFETKARTRWKEMVVLFSAHKTEKEAWDKIVWMGNKVAGGVSFEEIAKNNSDGFTSNQGGLRDWTSRGSLTSEDVEKAIFTLPVGQLSPIIKSDQGLHIVQVIEREDDKVTPFVEAQVAIRQKIQMQRRNKHADEYFEELNRRFPTIVLREKIDFNLNRKIPATPSPIR